MVDFTYGVWLGSFALALVLVAAGLMGAVLRRPRGEPDRSCSDGNSPRQMSLLWVAWALASLVPAAIVAADLVQRTYAVLSPDRGKWLVAAVLTVLALCSFWLGGRFVRAQKRGPAVHPGRAMWFALLAMNALAAAAAMVRFSAAVDPQGTDVADLGGGIPGVWVPQPAMNVEATTDRGRPVALFTPPPGIDDSGERSTVGDGYRLRVIEVERTDDNANCHGWVFSGGKYLMIGRDVAVILEDNGYVPVQSPAPGDLIVYRGDGAQIEHSGVVKFVDSQGLILVESKWGVQGRFIHRPEEFGYLPYTFYRSPRKGHLLRFSQPLL